MSNLVLKEQVMAKLLETDDEHLLEGVYRLLALESHEDLYILSDDQKSVINESRIQFERGEFISNEDLNSKIEKWLSK